jgi:Leucine-rich repeat (LRR) protein
LSGNQLSILPDVFSKLTSLVTLKLKNNQLKRLSVTFSVLKNLDTLELIGNPELGAMPQSFQKLQLNHLSISSKCLTTDVAGLIVEDRSSNFPLLTDLCLASLNKSGCRSVPC